MREASHKIAVCACAVLAALVLAVAACAGTVTFDLGSPVVNGSRVDFPLTANYASADAKRLVEFQIDVSGSSAELAPGGDFSAFSFTVAPALQGDWNPVSTVFGSGNPLAEAHTTTLPLTGDHLLGTLSIDLGSLGLPMNVPYTVRINGSQTFAGDEDPADHTTFGDAQVLFARESQTTTGTAVVPLPGAFWAGLPLLGALFLRRAWRCC